MLLLLGSLACQGTSTGSTGSTGATGGSGIATGSTPTVHDSGTPGGSTLTGSTADTGPGTVSGVGFYTTDFDGDEDPLSEGGAWRGPEPEWTPVRKSGGLAFGTQTGYGGYDDSYAFLSGFGADQQAEAVLHFDQAAFDAATTTHEVELLLRWDTTPDATRGYECNIGYAGGAYAQIVRWNGTIGDFSPIGGGNPYTLTDGAVMRATAVGSVISLYLDDVLLTSIDDATYADGNPGVGFFRREGGTNEEFAFTSFTATDL